MRGLIGRGGVGAAGFGSGVGFGTGARARARRWRSSGDRGGTWPGLVGASAGMPTGAPQRGHTERREAISSRARRCLPQVQTNLIVMAGRGANSNSQAANPKQAPNPNNQNPLERLLVIGIWYLFGLWLLGFGVFLLRRSQRLEEADQLSFFINA